MVEHRTGPGDERPESQLAAYRDFLGEAGVESEFYAVKALAGRQRKASSEQERLARLAGAARVEAERRARASDEEGRRRLAFTTGVTVAVLLAAADAIPAYLAAEAFGLDQPTTIGISIVLVGGLATAMWGFVHQTSRWGRGLLASALGAGLVAIGALRWWFLIVTAGDVTSALLEAAGLTTFTTLMIWCGVVVLGVTKARDVSIADDRARSLRRQAEQAAAQHADLRRRFDIARRELIAQAQVFSTRTIDDDQTREGFLENLRSDIEK